MKDIKTTPKYLIFNVCYVCVKWEKDEALRSHVNGSGIKQRSREAESSNNP